MGCEKSKEKNQDLVDDTQNIIPERQLFDGTNLKSKSDDAKYLFVMLIVF